MSQDPVKVDPAATKVLFENERIRVLQITLKGRQKMGLHSHPACLVYAVSGAKMKLTAPDGKVDEGEMKAGEVSWNEPYAHAVENLTDNVFTTLVFELKK